MKKKNLTIDISDQFMSYFKVELAFAIRTLELQFNDSFIDFYVTKIEKEP